MTKNKLQQLNKTVLVAVIASYLTACLTLASRIDSPIHSMDLATHEVLSLDNCRRWIDTLESQVKKEDAQYQRIDNIAWLRTDRFWASIPRDSVTSAQFVYEQQVKIGTEAFLDELFLVGSVNEAYVKRCIALLSQHDMPEYYKPEYYKLKYLEKVGGKVDDHYSAVKRGLGMYPIIKRFALKGILEYQAESKQQIDAFAQKLALGLPSKNYTRYSLLDDRGQPEIASEQLLVSDVSHIVSASYKRNSMAIPMLKDRELKQLFRFYSPSLVVESLHQDDVVSSIKMLSTGEIVADRESPVVYTFPSYTRFNGEKLLQLNYAFWFPSRPSNDVYGGFLDGIIWRVTLDKRGDVLLYDSIHQCGCYHSYFVPESRRNRWVDKVGDKFSEPAMVFTVSDSSKPTIFINTVEHYILAVNSPVHGNFNPRDANYVLEEYRQLSRLSAKNNDNVVRASLFGADGLVKGTERSERFYFWPLGIKSAGAMRQKGTHATAFVGRQHFDDAFLLEEVFGLATK